MPWELQLIVIIGSFIVLMLLGVPVAFALMLVSFVGLYVWGSPVIAVSAFGELLYGATIKYVLLAVPLFIFMANVVSASQITSRVYSALSVFWSGCPGGLGLSTNWACSVFGTVSGASIATIAAIGPIALEEMVQKRNYSKTFAAGTVSGAGGLSVIIPPSIPLIIYGFVANTSVARLFIAAIIPGIMMAVLYSVAIMIWAAMTRQALESLGHVTWQKRVISLRHILPILGIAVVVLGSICLGVSTVTEAATVGSILALTLCAAYRKLTFATLYKALVDTAIATGFLLFIVLGAVMFGFLLTYLLLPLQLVRVVAGLDISPIGVLVMAGITMILAGCFMDTSSLLLVMVPILLPLVEAVGYTDLIVLGLVFVLTVEMGLTTPPFGYNIFTMLGIGRPYGVTYGQTVLGGVPFLVCDAIILALLIAFPSIARILA